jgi:hypothetical protein
MMNARASACNEGFGDEGTTKHARVFLEHVDVSQDCLSNQPFSTSIEDLLDPEASGMRVSSLNSDDAHAAETTGRLLLKQLPCDQESSPGVEGDKGGFLNDIHRIVEVEQKPLDMWDEILLDLWVDDEVLCRGEVGTVRNDANTLRCVTVEMRLDDSIQPPNSRSSNGSLQARFDDPSHVRRTPREHLQHRHSPGSFDQYPTVSTRVTRRQAIEYVSQRGQRFPKHLVSRGAAFVSPFVCASPANGELDFALRLTSGRSMLTLPVIVDQPETSLRLEEMKFMTFITPCRPR